MAVKWKIYCKSIPDSHAIQAYLISKGYKWGWAPNGASIFKKSMFFYIHPTYIKRIYSLAGWNRNQGLIEKIKSSPVNKKSFIQY